jgi:hypothetical protein
MGGQEDSYLKLQGECHPDFMAMPIGTANGAKMCLRRQGECGKRIGTAPLLREKSRLNDQQGYHRGSVRMYDPQANFPMQTSNPQYYADRRTPWEQDLLRADYLHWGIAYNGTGVKTLQTPAQLRDSGTPYWQYGYTFTPPDGYDTGDHPAVSLSQAVPPPKYDLTRLHQPYPIWKHESERIGVNQNWRDVRSFSRIV